MAWDWIAKPRLDLLSSDTGFAHFGPYVSSDCGVDGKGTGDYPVSFLLQCSQFSYSLYGDIQRQIKLIQIFNILFTRNSSLKIFSKYSTVKFALLQDRLQLGQLSLWFQNVEF